jgi:hypothetical protein
VTSPFHSGTPSIPAKPKTLSRQNRVSKAAVANEKSNNVPSVETDNDDIALYDENEVEKRYVPTAMAPVKAVFFRCRGCENWPPSEYSG